MELIFLLVDILFKILKDPRVTGNSGAVMLLVGGIVYLIVVHPKKKKKEKKKASQEQQEVFEEYKIALENNHLKTIEEKLEKKLQDNHDAILIRITDFDRTAKALHKRLDEEVKTRETEDKAQAIQMNGFEIKLEHIKETIDEIKDKLPNGKRRRRRK